MKSRSKPRPQQRKRGGRKYRQVTLGGRYATLAEHAEALRLGHPDASRPERAWKPTRDDRAYIERLTAYGMTLDQIVQLIEDRWGYQVDPDMISALFKRELANGREKTVAEIAERLYKKAKSGHPGSMIFFLKTKGRWAQTLQLADPSGRPLQAPTVSISFGDEEPAPAEETQP